jgi:cellulose synthase/poly-beta-1,6-N-acetylglucosamine synthase-like glycosyltransferase
MIVSLIWDLHDKISRHESVKLSGELCALRPSLVRRIPTNLATDEPYIEMLIRREGYEVAYSPDAIVYVRGPENISEIVKHRRRIWTGHLQIKRMEGFVVSTSDFGQILPMMVKSFRSNLRSLHVLSLFVALEIYAYLLARNDIRKDRIPFVWETLRSTKTALCGDVREV